MNLIEGTRDPIGDGGCRIAPTAIDCAPMPDITTGRRGHVEVTAPPRSRATSGFHIGGLHPLRFAERLAELGNLLAHIGGPAWACSSTVAQMSADAERLTRLVLDGKEPLQFTYVQVTDEPEFVVASVLEGLARHLPDVRVTAWNDCRSMR